MSLLTDTPVFRKPILLHRDYRMKPPWSTSHFNQELQKEHTARCQREFSMFAGCRRSWGKTSAWLIRHTGKGYGIFSDLVCVLCSSNPRLCLVTACSWVSPWRLLATWSCQSGIRYDVCMRIRRDEFQNYRSMPSQDTLHWLKNDAVFVACNST